MDEGKNFSFSEIRRNYVHPYPLYAALRESDSIFWDATSQCWLVTAYAPVVAILHDPRFSSALDTASSLQLPSVHKQMLFMDGEAHQQAQSVLLHPLAQMAKKNPAPGFSSCRRLKALPEKPPTQ